MYVSALSYKRFPGGQITEIISRIRQQDETPEVLFGFFEFRIADGIWGAQERKEIGECKRMGAPVENTIWNIERVCAKIKAMNRLYGRNKFER